MKPKEIIALFKNSEIKARHGDVIIVSDPAAPIDGKECPDRALAYGEVTGHSHALTRGKVLTVVNNLVQRTLIVGKLAKVDHEEHKASPLPKGTFRSGVQAQWTPEGLRRVQD